MMIMMILMMVMVIMAMIMMMIMMMMVMMMMIKVVMANIPGGWLDAAPLLRRTRVPWRGGCPSGFVNSG